MLSSSLCWSSLLLSSHLPFIGVEKWGGGQATPVEGDRSMYEAPPPLHVSYYYFFFCFVTQEKGN